MTEVSLRHGGVDYALTVDDLDDGRVEIRLTTTMPPLGLAPDLYSFTGRLATREQRETARAAQQRVSASPPSAHDARRR